MTRFVYPLDGPGGPLEGIDMDALPEPVRQEYYAYPYDAHRLEAGYAQEQERQRAYLATLTPEGLAIRQQQIQAYLGGAAI